MRRYSTWLCIAVPPSPTSPPPPPFFSSTPQETCRSVQPMGNEDPGAGPGWEGRRGEERRWGCVSLAEHFPNDSPSSLLLSPTAPPPAPWDTDTCFVHSHHTLSEGFIDYRHQYQLSPQILCRLVREEGWGSIKALSRTIFCYPFEIPFGKHINHG